jgi:hypothetical protein
MAFTVVEFNDTQIGLADVPGLQDLCRSVWLQGAKEGSAYVFNEELIVYVSFTGNLFIVMQKNSTITDVYRYNFLVN